jgi:hypothetical protein
VSSFLVLKYTFRESQSRWLYYRSILKYTYHTHPVPEVLGQEKRSPVDVVVIVKHGDIDGALVEPVDAPFLHTKKAAIPSGNELNEQNTAGAGKGSEISVGSAGKSGRTIGESVWKPPDRPWQTAQRYGEVRGLGDCTGPPGS